MLSPPVSGESRRPCYNRVFMASATLCAICHQRKAKRHCPGVQGEICAQCCGTEREVTVDCPFECSYLREARRYEAEKVKLHAEDIPFPEIEVLDSFLYEHEQLIGQIGYRILRYGLENPRVVDNDVKDALEEAENLEDFQERVSDAMDSLIAEAQGVKVVLCGKDEPVVLEAAA